MISLQKLKANLAQSEAWGATFKTEVKRCMEEITIKNQQISQIGRLNLELQSSIQNAKTDLKNQNDVKMKVGYKTDKIQIKIQELQNRVKLYEDIYKKKIEWNKELTNRLMLLEVDIERARSSIEDHQINDLTSEKPSQLSVCGSISSNLTFKEDSIKRVLGDPRLQIDNRLKRVKKLEENYLREHSNCSALQRKLESAQRKGQRLQEELKELQKQYSPQPNKQNINFQPDLEGEFPQNCIKETRTAAKTLRQLQEKGQKLNFQIKQMHESIEQYSKTLNQLVLNDTEASQIHKVTVGLQKEAKKEKNAMYSLKSYILGKQND